MTTIFSDTAHTIGTTGEYIMEKIANQKGTNTIKEGNGIKILTNGIYDIEATVTGLVTGGGDINAQIFINGVAVPYLKATATTATGEPDTLTISGKYIFNKCNCNNNLINVPIITLVNAGDDTGSISFASLSVTKI